MWHPRPCRAGEAAAAAASCPQLGALEAVDLSLDSTVKAVLAANDALVVQWWLARVGIAPVDTAREVLVLREALGRDAPSIAAAADELVLCCHGLGLDPAAPWPVLAARDVTTPLGPTGAFPALCHASRVEHAEIVAGLVRAGVPGNLAELAELAAVV